MKTSTCSWSRPLLICAAVLSAATQTAFAADDPKCLARFEAEVGRIEREAAATAPRTGDQGAQHRWSVKLHAAMEAAAQESEACNRRSRPKPSAQAIATLNACLDGAAAKLALAEKRYQGRNLSMDEQRAQRADQQRALDERDACTRAHRN